jgi:DNA-binding MarR family transcriptional regulator
LVIDNYRSDPGAAPTARRQLAELCFGVVRRLRSHAAELAAEHDLSFLQARALWRLEQPLATGTLAERLGLDRSNITHIVDGLETRGLVTREAQRDDRRVKLLTLTPAGRAVRAALDERIFATQTLFESLTEDEQATLAGLLTKLLEAAAATEPAPAIA